MLVQRIPNKSRENEERVRRLFESIRRRFQAHDINSHTDIKRELMEAFAMYFKSAGKAHYEFEKLDPDAPRFASLWNKIQETLADDFDVAYKETQSLLRAALSAFDYQQTMTKGLDHKLEKAVSALQDLQIIREHTIEPVFVAGDDFKDASRIDTRAPLSNPMVELPSYQEIVTLNRESSENILADGDTDIQVLPSSSSQVELYEGRMFAIAGQAEPEGPEFRFASAAGLDRLTIHENDGIDPDLLDRYRNYLVDKGSSALLPQDGMDAAKRQKLQELEGFTKDEWEWMSTRIHDVGEIFTLPPQRARTFQLSTDEEVYLYDSGATDEEKQANRQKMTDENPDSYWQVEYVADAGERLLPWVDADSNTFPTTVSEDALRAAAKTADAALGMDFSVTLVFDMKRARQINWINLSPQYFAKGDVVEVKSISTSEEGADFVLIEGWNQDRYENTLTADVNEELSQEELSVTLSPSKYSYRGQGVWTFPPVRARYVRVVIEQKVPEVVPYNLVTLQIKETKSMTSKTKNIVGKVKRKRYEKPTYKELNLSYPESLLLLDGTNTSTDFVPTGEGDHASSHDRLGSNAWSGVNIGKVVADPSAGVAFTVLSTLAVFGLFGSVRGVRRRFWEQTEVTDQFTTTHWDRVRYAIGVKEFGVYTHSYSSASELISMPYFFPRPVKKLHVRADQAVPEAFGPGTWVEYYVAFGGGDDWQRVLPLQSAETPTAQLPKILNINSTVEEMDRVLTEGYLDVEGSVKEMRTKIVLRRPGDKPYLTPVVHGYRVIAFTR